MPPLSIRDVGVDQARLWAIKRDLAANLSSSMRIGEFARKHGLSARQLQRLFASQGETFRSYLTELRLAEARRALADPQGRERTIGSVAFESGFGDISHFNRLFRRKFQATPSQVRVRSHGNA